MRALRAIPIEPRQAGMHASMEATIEPVSNAIKRTLDAVDRDWYRDHEIATEVNEVETLVATA